MAVHSCGYLAALFDGRFKESVDTAIKTLTPKADQFDAIACTGLSGTLIAPIIAYHLSKPLIVVRKSNKESPHSGRLVEGADCVKYLILDDVISSGTTIRNIIANIKQASILGKPVAIFLWRKPYPHPSTWTLDPLATNDFLLLPVWSHNNVS